MSSSTPYPVLGLTSTEGDFKNTESGRHRQGSGASPRLAIRLQPSPRGRAGGDEVAYIIAWTLGPPVSLIILFLLLFGS